MKKAPAPTFALLWPVKVNKPDGISTSYTADLGVVQLLASADENALMVGRVPGSVPWRDGSSGHAGWIVRNPRHDGDLADLAIHVHAHASGYFSVEVEYRSVYRVDARCAAMMARALTRISRRRATMERTEGQPTSLEAAISQAARAIGLVAIVSRRGDQRDFGSYDRSSWQAVPITSGPTMISLANQFRPQPMEAAS